MSARGGQAPITAGDSCLFAEGYHGGRQRPFGKGKISWRALATGTAIWEFFGGVLVVANPVDI